MALARAVLSGHVWLYRRTRGRRGGMIAGTPVLLLTTTGRRTGVPRTRPLGHLRDGERFVVCGSNGGAAADPAWSLNLRSNPVATVEVAGESMTVTATEATGEEYEDLWRAFTTAYPRYAGYREKTTRRVPLFVLEPTGGPR